jgi:uncharacterized membrane protein
MKKLIIVTLIAATVYSCSYDNREELSKQEICQSDSITFSKNIQPLISQRCTSCHSGQFPEAGISLTSYQVISQIAKNGKLVGVVSHAAGFPAMPADGSSLSKCEISQIKTWVDEGSQNN